MPTARTYFQDRIDSLELSRLLAGDQPFFLENVADVDDTAAAMAAELAGRNRSVRIDETRSPYSVARDMAIGFLPGPLVLVCVAWLGGRALLAWLRNPHPDVVLLKKTRAVEFVFKRRGSASQSA